MKREQKLESLKDQEEVNVLEGDGIFECGLTVEISRMTELLQAVCGVLAGDDVVKNKTALQTSSRNEYLFFCTHISET